jgi:hypothetical protein
MLEVRQALVLQARRKAAQRGSFVHGRRLLASARHRHMADAYAAVRGAVTQNVRSAASRY